MRKFHVYGDESCTQLRYTTIGSVFCNEDSVTQVNQLLEEVMRRHGPTSELKWSKVKRKNLPLYLEIVDLFCDLRRRNVLHYYCIVIDNSKMDHKKYNDGDKEIGFNKMLFFHLLNYSRRYRNAEFKVFLDDRTTKHTPDRLRMMLNGRVAREQVGRPAPYRLCQFRLSHEVRLIQLADILTGAIGAAMNSHHLRADSAAHKVSLIGRVEAGCGHPSLRIATGQRLDGFEIWHFRFD